MQMIFSY